MAVDIKEFLLERIAEDESYARQIVDADWSTFSPNWEVSNGGTFVDIGEPDSWGVSTDHTPVSYFIARFDPARILAEVAAKRAVIEASDLDSGAPDGHDMAEWMREEVLKALAAPYSYHPEFDPEWSVA